MQPSLEAELAGMGRSLAALAADDAVAKDVRRELKGVIRTLQRVEKSWSRVLPYLVADNDRLARLLVELAPLVPPDLRSDIEAASSEVVSPVAPALLDVHAVNGRNEALRSLVSRALSEDQRAGGDGAAAVRSRIAAALVEGLEDRPW